MYIIVYQVIKIFPSVWSQNGLSECIFKITLETYVLCSRRCTTVQVSKRPFVLAAEKGREGEGGEGTSSIVKPYKLLISDTTKALIMITNV